jgi:surface protein
MALGIGAGNSLSFIGGGGAPPPPPNPDFVSTWDTTQAGSASDTIVLPLLVAGVYSGTIDWGDATTSPLSYANRTHVYSTTGVKTITISGTIQGFQFNNSGDRRKLVDITNWGSLDISTSFAFKGCSNMVISATDAPVLSSVDLREMFAACTSLTTPDFSAWDTSSVTGMRGMFDGCTSFNGNIVDWDVSNVNNFFEMFRFCASFNQDISVWDVSNGSAMVSMFAFCTSFNKDLSSWVINTSSLSSMFGFSSFNNGGSPNINNWDVSMVTNLSTLFRSTPFNQPIGLWDISNVNTLFRMFESNSTFNQDITGWDTSSVNNFGEMFKNATSFNQAIGGWDTSLVTAMKETFQGATSFNQDISNWDVNQVTNLSGFMAGITLSTANYDALLIAWDAQGAMAYSGTVNFGTSKYTAGGAAQAARTSLISKWGGITDGGPA